jgi:hypothetical protein
VVALCLRFENDTDIQNGLTCTYGSLPVTITQVTHLGVHRLGKLKGNIGGQNYDLPDG